MPVYKLILPVIAFSSKRPLPSLRTQPMSVFVDSREPERSTASAENSFADDGQTPPSAGKPFG